MILERRSLATVASPLAAILASLIEQPSDAYGITLRDRLRRKVSLGPICSSLEHIETKGTISSW
jgi:hypothetical protein